MAQIEELKAFVSERLNVVASEIFGAVEKTLTRYEEQASFLKKENDRNRSLLDIILKTKTTREQGHTTKNTPAAPKPPALPRKLTREPEEIPPDSSDLQWFFTSDADFLKFAKSAPNGKCPYCHKSSQASETHLRRRHYLNAVHLAVEGTRKIIVPCVCNKRIQVDGRSHWHCPLCRTIILRKCSFEKHLHRQHSIEILQKGQNAEINQLPVSAFEEEPPMGFEPWCEQNHGSPDPENLNSSLLHLIKGEEMSHSELQNSELLQTKEDQIQRAYIQMGGQCLDADRVQCFASNTVSEAAYTQDPSEINNGKNSTAQTQPLNIQPESGVGGIWQPVRENQQSTGNKIEKCKTDHKPSTSSTMKKPLKRSLPSWRLNVMKSSPGQNPRAQYGCKACGKTFHYMYTLRTHAQSHTVDEIHICGICGKHFESTGSLVQHLQRHYKRYKCDVCGKLFSNDSRLERHRRFHSPKALTGISSC